MAVSTERMGELFHQWDKECHLPQRWQDKDRYAEQRKWRENLTDEEKEVLSFWDSTWLLHS
jgi:hypothetical protein